MPNDKFDSKSFNPQAFKYMVGRVPNLHMHEIKKSKALAGNPDIKATLGGSQGGTGYARIAMRGLLDGDAVNYDGQTDIAATSTKTFEQGMAVIQAVLTSCRTSQVRLVNTGMALTRIRLLRFYRVSFP